MGNTKGIATFHVELRDFGTLTVCDISGKFVNPCLVLSWANVGSKGKGNVPLVGHVLKYQLFEALQQNFPAARRRQLTPTHLDVARAETA